MKIYDFSSGAYFLFRELYFKKRADPHTEHFSGAFCVLHVPTKTTKECPVGNVV
jgi:hypothetical protein